MESMKELPKAYEPAAYEDAVYAKWETSGAFKPASDAKKALRKKLKPYTILMPPPNATAQLHTGHAIMVALEDALVRYHRMKGFDTLYLPGTDHAAIATASVVDRQLAKEGIDKRKLGRDKFAERARLFALENKATIENQIKALGASADWDRNAFTMDKPREKAVTEAFHRLYKSGLVYRDDYMVNWCPHCRTVLADDEVEHQESEGVLYYMKYGPFELATTRPETKVGDTAVAVNPKDKRYRKYVGKEIEVQTINGVRQLRVITDEMVDPEFGTGVVKITPFHDKNDYDVYRRNPDEAGPPIEVIGEDGVMTTNAGKLAGLDRFAARERMVEWLKEEGLLVREELHHHSVGHCYRCSTVIEPRISNQWFLRVSALTHRALEFVDQSELKFLPLRFEKSFRHWMENLHDWCISRQIWYGHPIPVYLKGNEVSLTQKAGFTPSTDTLDTWFSSALWPFSTLGWPDETPDLERFFPGDVLETGYDIIPLWVSRMVLMTIALDIKDTKTGEVKPPFHTAYLHGLVRDKRGRKFSKTLGNGVDPLELIGKYGTDALRFVLATGSTPGNDIRFDEERLVGARNFANKLWNIARFVIAQEYDPSMPTVSTTESAKDQSLAAGIPRDSSSSVSEKFAPNAGTTASAQGQSPDTNSWLHHLRSETLTTADRAILHRLDETARLVESTFYDSAAYDKPGAAPLPEPQLSGVKTATYDLARAGNALQSFIWSDFADWYLEIAKVQLKDADAHDNTNLILRYVLETVLALLHPYMPFVTEVLWSDGLAKETPLITSQWPKLHQNLNQPEDAARFAALKGIVETIRRLRVEQHVPPGAWIQAILVTDEPGWLLENADAINQLARLKMLHIVAKAPKGPAVSALSGPVTVLLPAAGLVDEAAEAARLQAEIKQTKVEVDRLKTRLDNKDYARQAPSHVVAQTRQHLAEAKKRLAKLEAGQ